MSGPRTAASNGGAHQPPSSRRSTSGANSPVRSQHQPRSRASYEGASWGRQGASDDDDAAAADDDDEDDYWDDPDTPTIESQRRSANAMGKVRLDDDDDHAAMPLRPIKGAAAAAAGRRRKARGGGGDGSQYPLGGSPGPNRRRGPKALLDWARRRPFWVLSFLAGFGLFAWSLNKFLRWYLNPDKEPLPWRTYCQEQPPFPHAYADALAPVDVFVGILTTVDTFERRSIIRQTMNSQTLPLDPASGRAMGNVQVKFILGRPSKHQARKVALEAETFNDVVVLDMDDTGSARKTLNFLKWASVNATVPVKVPAGGGGGGGGKGEYRVAWKMVDYVVKSDDDTFIVLDELERHLRVTPRKMTYWGYLVKSWFMAGEAYALSSDLVQWLATNPQVEATAYGKEDVRTPRWLALHPQYDSIHWRSERCWIYDHPRANTPYSHGFLFPDEVERIKLEGKLGLTSQQLAQRGGEHASHWFSTVIRWGEPYRPPRPDLTAEEEAEALVEGKGRWGDSDFRRPPRKGSPRADLVFESQDVRLRPEGVKGEGHPALAYDVGLEPQSGLLAYGFHPNGTSPPPPSQEPPSPPPEPPAPHHPPPKARSSAAEAVALSRRSDDEVGGGVAELGGRAYASVETPATLAEPFFMDEEGEEAELRSKRYLGKPHGGTVIVHYQKTTERWMETALVLLGKRALWSSRQTGPNGPSREWRMYGSPSPQPNGFVTERL